jgi:putative transcriptional regulator
MKPKINLQGSILVANPSVTGDSKGAVILIFSHSLGIVQGVCINKPHPTYDQLFLMEHLGFKLKDPLRLVDQPVFLSGNDKIHQGIVIHDKEPDAYQASNTINKDICLTLSNDVLIDIAAGDNTPSNYLIAIGRYSWSANDLLKLIKYGRYFLLNFDFDIAMRIPYDKKYAYCYEKLGFNPNQLSSSNMVNFDDITTLDPNLEKLYWIEHKEKEFPNEH